MRTVDTMTAEVMLHPSAGALADETVRRAIKALIEGRGENKEVLAKRIGMTPSTLYRRLAGRGSSQAFSAGEVYLIATYFAVPIGDIYSGFGGAFAATDAEVNTAQRRPVAARHVARDRRRPRIRRRRIHGLPTPVIARSGPDLRLVVSA